MRFRNTLCLETHYSAAPQHWACKKTPEIPSLLSKFHFPLTFVLYEYIESIHSLTFKLIQHKSIRSHSGKIYTQSYHPVKLFLIVFYWLLSYFYIQLLLLVRDIVVQWNQISHFRFSNQYSMPEPYLKNWYYKDRHARNNLPDYQCMITVPLGNSLPYGFLNTGIIVKKACYNGQNKKTWMITGPQNGGNAIPFRKETLFSFMLNIRGPSDTDYLPIYCPWLSRWNITTELQYNVCLWLSPEKSPAH